MVAAFDVGMGGRATQDGTTTTTTTEKEIRTESGEFERGFLIKSKLFILRPRRTIYFAWNDIRHKINSKDDDNTNWNPCDMKTVMLIRHF